MIPNSRSRKSGHTIRDILGHTDEDCVEKKEPVPENLKKVTIPSISIEDEDKPQPHAPEKESSPDSEDEDVNVEVDDEEQLWD